MRTCLRAFAYLRRFFESPFWLVMNDRAERQPYHHCFDGNALPLRSQQATGRLAFSEKW